GLDVPLRSLSSLRRVARVALPVVGRLPFKWFYPTGTAQDAPAPRARFGRHYAWAEVLAGDWHYIRRHAPADLAGKDVLKNTPTQGVDGLSMGTSRLVAVLVALEGAAGG